MTRALVIGGTGAMGGLVVRRLAARDGTDVAVLTRDTDSERATALRNLGRVTLVRGDLDDAASLATAMEGVDEVFANTDFYATERPSGERDQGLAALAAAERAGVRKFVWSSLDSAAALTDGRIPVPHYDSKAAVAAHIALRRSEEMMRQDPDGWYSRHVAVLVTAPYFENLQFRIAPRRGLLPDGRDGLVFAIPLGEGRYPLIGLQDIAWFADHLLRQWDTWAGRNMRAVGDSLTGSELAATFERVTGIPSAYEPVPLQVVRDAVPRVGHDLAAMVEFFQAFDVFDRARDILTLRTIHPRLLTFEGWLRRTGWTGGVQDVQKRAESVSRAFDS